MFIWTISDVLGLTVLGVIIIVYLYQTLSKIYRYTKCSHDGKLYETQACDAICSKCGKNLGFIGNLKRK